jgi:triosephosphate isomerase
LIPPATSIATAVEALAGTNVYVGAQHVHWKDQGAYTGELSAGMAAECGARLVQIGHSERRHIFGETDEQVRLKVGTALRHNLIPLLCVGEPQSEVEFGTAAEYIARQLKIAISGLEQREAARIWVAYEPVWAIGSGGKPADPEYAEYIHGNIKQTLAAELGTEMAESIPVLYGGSVNAANAPHYILRKGIDGVFVGRAALDVQSFIQLIRTVTQAYWQYTFDPTM